MPLASKDGKLYFKDGKLCSSCCNQGSSGACCFLNDNGEYDCRLTSESRCDELGGDWYEDEECKSDDNPDGIDCSLPPQPTELGCCYVDIGDGTLQSQGRTTKADCQAAQDEVDPSIECTWIADTEETKDQPCPDQPVYPPVPGICLYRDDERGTCTAYYVEGSGGACDEGATLEECYEQQVEPALQESFPPGNGAYYFYYGTDGDEDSLYWEALTVTSSDPAGDFLSTEDECLESVYYSCPDPSFPADAQTVGGSITCQEFADQANALAPYTWANDMPATDCRPVSSEDECTESTGEFCANVTDCNDPSLEISAGCPETQNRRNPLP
jgi:hypothetical protein